MHLMSTADGWTALRCSECGNEDVPSVLTIGDCDGTAAICFPCACKAVEKLMPPGTLDRWDQTAPAIQRATVAAIANRVQIEPPATPETCPGCGAAGVLQCTCGQQRNRPLT